MNISVVIPVFNSEESLPALVGRLHPVLESLGETYELIMVNDGSADGSWEAIRKLAARHDWIRGINLMRNYGQHNALLRGILAAANEVIVTMDDDLQNPPEEIPKLIEKLNEGHDVVYGIPDRERHGLWRNAASRLTKLAMKTAMGVRTASDVSAFRAFRTNLRESFSDFRSPFVIIDVLLTWGTTKFSSVKLRHDPRRQGGSNYTFRKLLAHSLNMITSFSTLPLQLASLMGFVFTLFGLGVLVVVVGRLLLEGSSVPGFPFLASVIAIFSGVQLFSLGIIGEYLARMHFRTLNRPPYAEREAVGFDRGEERPTQ